MKKITLILAALALVLVSCAPKQGAPAPASTPVKQTTPNPANAAIAQQFLESCGNYYLSTVEGDQPRVRPFGTAEIFEGKLYIQTGKVKNVYKQLLANP